MEKEYTSSTSSQSEMPFALVQGEPLTVIPQDLYIPPDALLVFLEAFEGPLDLLLYLIKRQNVDILNIPIAAITKQYMEYIHLMDNLELELAAEYLVMASMLAEIKSRMLLPRPIAADDEDDPRAELVRRLQEYEQFKKAAEDLEALDRLEREIHLTSIDIPRLDIDVPVPEVSLADLMSAFRDVVNRAEQFASHHVDREPLSVRERMVIVLDRINADEFTSFHRFLRPRRRTHGSSGQLYRDSRAAQGIVDRTRAKQALCTHLRQGKILVDSDHNG